ncbi:MAG: hypothetical protein JXB60_09300 [Candidatus Cloacimonetes bacterium]|nr:hypothetical protein [Candidatus Cloacimonadota bacterium]
MKNFQEEIKRRREERRTSRSSSWIHLLLKILLFIIVVLLIRYFGNPDPEKFRTWKNIDRNGSATKNYEDQY